MEHFPVEIRRIILENLQLRDVATLRLVSKVWGTVGYEYLLPTCFPVYRHPRHMHRLCTASKDARLAHRIKSLEFFLAELDADMGASKPITCSTILRFILPFGILVADFDRCLADLRRGVVSWRDACTSHSFRQAFSSLPSLKHISIRIAKRPHAWGKSSDVRLPPWMERQSRRETRPHAASNFVDLLAAIADCPSLELESFSHDWVPLKVFSRPSPATASLFSNFARLTTRALTIEDVTVSDSSNAHARASARSHALTQLAQGISKARNLRTLELAFEGIYYSSINALMAAFRDLDARFCDLESLTLQNVVIRESDLVSFVINQRQLKSLVLGGGRNLDSGGLSAGGVVLREGTFEGLVARVRSESTVERVQVQGHVEEVSTRRSTSFAKLEDPGLLGERPGGIYAWWW